LTTILDAKRIEVIVTLMLPQTVIISITL